LLEKGESVGLVGESGSGKTTVGRLLLKLTPLSAGQLSFEGDFLDRMDRARTLRFRQQAQLVFQNPFDALNPRFSIRRSLAEPLRNTGVDRAEHEPRIAEALRLVKLDDAKRHLEALPHQLSGGQLQRVVLARALVVKPVFLVADEPVSMLDVSVRAGILNLLRDLKQRLGLTAFYISHDLTLVRYVCERTLVMYLGKVVEDGSTAEVIQRPAHPYSITLLAAFSHSAELRARWTRLPDAADDALPAGGCSFASRCVRRRERCLAEAPAPRPLAGGRFVRCHFPVDESVAAEGVT